MICFRVDGNDKIGIGHVMRCLTYANAVRKAGGETCFLLADANVKGMLEKQGHKVRVLGTDYCHMESELPVLTDILKREGADTLVVDSYFVTKAYFKELRDLVKLGYVDDMNADIWDVDFLINYNVYGEQLGYETQNVSDRMLLLGCQYAPIRPEFTNTGYQIRKRAQNLLITTGGSDLFNIAGQAAEAILESKKNGELFEQIKIHIVAGAFNVHKPFLRELALRHEDICLHENVTDMAALMTKCDMAISAAGSTTYELCAVGVPTISFAFVDNQERILDSMEKKKAVYGAGCYHKNSEAVLKQFIQGTGALIQNDEMRKSYSEHAKALVDGKGAQRIADFLFTRKLPIS